MRQDGRMASPVDPRPGRSLPPGVDPRAGNADSVTPIAPPISAVPTTKAVLTAGWTTGLTAGLVCLAIRVLAGLFGTEFRVAAPDDGRNLAVSWVAALVVPVLSGMAMAAVGGLFLGVRGARRWVFWIGTAVLLVSLVSPWVWAFEATWPTRFWLAVMQLLTWLLVVPQVARVVGDSDPKVTAAYREPGE